MAKIIKVLGDVDDSFISNEIYREYCQKLKKSLKDCKSSTVDSSIKSRFSDQSKVIQKLLLAMLEFNPKKRLSASQLIKNKAFD